MRTRTYGLDRDTIAYANRIKVGSGKVLDSNAIKQINKFVVGIKRLGLWNSMVCWPMRSIHNAGTGSTVYSLGGLGVYNGTMTNSPTWGRDGVVFTDATSQSVITTLTPANPVALSLFAVAQCKPHTSAYCTLASTRNFSVAGGFTASASNGQNNAAMTPWVSSGVWTSPITTGGLYADSKFHYFSAYYDSASPVKEARISGDGGAEVVSTSISSTVGNPVAMYIGAEIANSRCISGAMPFLFYILGYNNMAYVKNLYRGSIGQNLGLM